MVLTVAEIVTVAAITAVVDAGMVAVSESVVVQVAIEMIETGSSQGLTWDFRKDRHNDF